MSGAPRQPAVFLLVADLITYCGGDVEQALLLQRLQDRGPDFASTDWSTFDMTSLAAWTRMDKVRLEGAIERAFRAGNLGVRGDASGPQTSYRVEVDY